MKKAELRACETVSTTVAVNVWLLIAEKIEGYPGVTGYFYGPFDWCIYPSLTFTKPINEDPSKNLDDNKRRKKYERINR